MDTILNIVSFKIIVSIAEQIRKKPITIKALKGQGDDVIFGAYDLLAVAIIIGGTYMAK